jgi:hypothetical protein
MAWLHQLWSAPAEALADLFWSFATSGPVLAALALLVLACVVVTHVPLVRWLPSIDDWMKLASFIGYLAFAALFLLIGFRLSDERTEAKTLRTELAWSRNQLEQQEATARDAEKLKGEAEAAATEAKGKLNELRTFYSERPQASCAFTADDLRRLRDLRRHSR